MKNNTTVFHVALEPIPSRYSEQWLETITPMFNRWVQGKYQYIMVDVFGESMTTKTTSGGFLDFAATNYWKGSQQAKIAKMFEIGTVKSGDVFLFTDAWNPTILNVRYMSELLDIPVRIVSYWHAGSYDTWDTLGYKIKDRTWSVGAEQSFFHASDYNLFATKFHANFFKTHCLREFSNRYDHKIVISGQPHYKILGYFAGVDSSVKYQMPDGIKRETIRFAFNEKPLIIFPHRNCVEKQPEIFNALAERLSSKYQFIKTSDYRLSKEDYYKLLLNSDIVFSCAMHEMLGISMMEGYLAGAYPLMPRRLSYAEMWDEAYLYPSRWTEPGSEPNLDQLEYLFDNTMNIINREKGIIKPHETNEQRKKLVKQYLTCEPMWRAIVNDMVTYGI